MLSQRAWNILACPDCGRGLIRSCDAVLCTGCQTRYPADASGQPDLRLQRPKCRTIDIQLSSDPLIKPGFEFKPLRRNRSPQLDLTGVRLPPLTTCGNRLTYDLLSHFPRATAPGGFMLDIGCGRREIEAVCAGTNLEYIGLDYTGSTPDLLGDAHALPFKDEVFEFILCIAVLEHLRYPLLAMREAHRVLKPGKLLIGTVAFLEPFHMNSFYHHTFLGTYNSLSSAGFDVMQIEPNAQWTALKAISHMNLFYGLPTWVTDLIMMPVGLLNRMWSRCEDIRYQTRGSWDVWRQLATTGGYRFIAVKPNVRERQET